MTSARFAEFISIWRRKFGIERSIDERVCEDEEGRPLPWYTYPATEYLAQFNYCGKRVFEYGCGQFRPVLGRARRLGHRH